ncbi:MAG TPA: M14 family metallopeptidase [Bacteroidales bacterium]|nr:M14 family metallopeptidase [Bacteroidales bacterium]
MKKSILKFIIALALIHSAIPLPAQQGYSDYKTLMSRIDALARTNPGLCTVSPISKTVGGKEIRVITVGTGEKDSKPGIAVFGGVEGNYLLGREIAVALAESLVKGNGELLQKVTFYIFPDVSPDATEQYFLPLRYERTVNANPADDDRDFATDEDPFEDLDKDGMITHIRVTDPSGSYTTDPDDERLMIESDLSKGLTGGFLFFTEGIDNDDDGKFNEDGSGGANFNRNFSYDYEEFGLNAGLHPMSEPEVKAVADFLFDRFNIYTVIAFGPQDNLGQPFKNAPPSPDRRITSIMKSDEIINKLVSDRYHEITGLKGAPVLDKVPGNFMDWAYYHYGRYSFSTPGWWYPVEKGKNPESEFLKYAEKNKLTDVLVPWKPFEHPGFPGKKVETGGIRPFVMMNPPADSISAIANKHIVFITNVAEMHPALEFTGLETENAGSDVFRINVKVHNKGVFATLPEVGEMNSWTRIMRLSVETQKGQEIISGLKVQRISRLEGGQSAEFSWLIKGKGPVKITAGAVNTGIITSTADLR